MPAETLVIANPASAGGSTGRRWGRIEPLLRDALGELEVETTRAPRDAVRIAREAARAGVERILVAGGDGTTSEVVTGLVEAHLSAEVRLGLLPMGSGGDFRRGLGLPSDLPSAIDLLGSGATRRVDAGRLEYRDARGATRSAVFLNVASFGISGLVDEMVNRAPKTLGGTAAFALGALRALARYRSEDVRVRVDGEVVHEGPLLLAAVANGRYFGGGMHVAPGAHPDDGRFEVVVVEGMSRWRSLAAFPSLYRGTHVSDPAVTVYRGARVEAESPTGTVWLDVDGEALGTLPAAIEVLPGAVTLVGLPPGAEAS
ncbi:MAG: diacylglycerol/lipid kinase family protein [Myxococcota bacterium]